MYAKGKSDDDRQFTFRYHFASVAIAKSEFANAEIEPQLDNNGIALDEAVLPEEHPSIDSIVSGDYRNCDTTNISF